MKKSNYKIFQIGNVITGKTPSKKLKNQFGDYIPFYTPSDIEDERFISKTQRYLSKEGAKNLKKNIIPKNSILVTCIGSDMGKVVINKLEGVTNQQINAIVPNKKIDYLFLYYYLKSSRKLLKQLSFGGSTMPIINKTDFSNIELKIPDLKEQKKISNFLSKFDEKIEINQKINQNLENISKILFKSWMVDFDPVKAKAEERSTELSKEISDLFPSSFEESEFGKIPKGWKIYCLEDFINVVGGLSYKAEFLGNGINLVTMGCVSTKKRINLRGLKKYSGEFKDHHILKSKDIVVSTRDVTQHRVTLGAPALIPKTLENSVLATNMYKIKNLNNNLPPHLLFEILRTESYRQNIISSAKGSTVLMLTKDSLLKYKVVLPTDSLKRYLENILETFNLKIENLYLETKNLINLRDTLLIKLISGKLKILDAEKFTEQVSA